MNPKAKIQCFLPIATYLFAASPICSAEKVITIQLQGVPNSMEPVAQPAAVRVDDRSPVRLHLTNLSPLDICSITRSPAPTAETNPFESLISTITGLGALAISPQPLLNSLVSRNTERGIELDYRKLHPTTPNPRVIADSDEYRSAIAAEKKFETSISDSIQAQQAVQVRYDSESKALIDYLSRDYRAEKSVMFDPTSAQALADVRAELTMPVPTVVLVSANQSDVDEFKISVAKLHKEFDAYPESLAGLQKLDRAVAELGALLSVLNDNNKALADAQTKIKLAYKTAIQVKDDLLRRKDRGVIQQAGATLFQDFNLGSDRKATVTGALTCVSALDGKTPTTDTINYSILYQDIPVLSASAGFLTSFQGKRVVSTANQLVPVNGTPTYQTIFAITDSARAQLVPMAYANYRIGGYKPIPWGRTHESELATTFNLSAGFGVNPNSGTPQPEFFLGVAIGINRLMIHPGVHWGRTENLGGGFALNSVVPSTFTGSVPLNWGYHAAFSIGFSVRVAPY